MYKPAHRRRWGYFALPVLVGDELIGKLDAKAEPRAGVLRIARLHEDRPFTQDARGAVGEEINDLARWPGLETAGWERASSPPAAADTGSAPCTDSACQHVSIPAAPAPPHT